MLFIVFCAFVVVFICFSGVCTLTLVQKKVMVYGYIRVSSDKQTVENQRFEIQKFCDEKHVQVDGWIEETIAGTKSYTKRELGRLLRRTKAGDTIICSELSRLGRNLYMIMEILGLCMSKNCRVWTIKDGYRLGDDIQSKVLAFAFGLSAEIERNLISQRTKEALARLKAEGRKLGRPEGTCMLQRYYRLSRHDAYVRRALRKGMSQREIARRLHVSRNTVARYIRLFVKNNETPTEVLPAPCAAV